MTPAIKDDPTTLPGQPRSGCLLKGAAILRQSEAAANPSSYLDTLESPSQRLAAQTLERWNTVDGLKCEASYWGNPMYDPPTASPGESTFRHSGWAARRAKVFKAMVQTGSSSSSQQSFAECGAQCFTELRDDRQDIRLRGTCCHNRFCIPCAATRARRINFNVVEAIKGKTTRFVTLTLRCSNTGLNDQLDRLYRSFAALRRRVFWKENVTGGSAFCETKIGAGSGMWHVHLHILCQGRFMDQRRLSEEWHAVTGDSSIVDVRMVKNAENAAGYVVKYVTKPATKEVFDDPDKLQEMMLAMKGRRLILPFGTWAKLKLTEVPSDGHEWKVICTLDDLIKGAVDGDPERVRYFQAAQRKYPHFPWPTLDLPPPECPGQLPLLDPADTAADNMHGHG